MTDRIGETRSRRFRPYPEYRDSGVEWLGEIPAHWSPLLIKRVCRFCYGESLASNDRANGNVVVFGSNGPVGTHDSANTGAPCLIVGRKGSFGKVNYSADAVFAIDTTFVTDARYTQADLRWLYYTLQFARLDTVSKDSAIPGLAREDAYARVIAVVRFTNSLPSPLFSTARRRESMGWWRERSDWSSCFRRNAPRSSPAPSPGASTRTFP